MVRDDKINYSEMGDALLGLKNVYSSENLRKVFYFLDKFIDNINGDYQITDNDLIREIEWQKEDLYKIKVQTRDKIRELNKKLTEQSRYENLVEVYEENLQALPIIKECNLPKSKNENVEASLLLSDWHFGIKVDNQLNYYDVETAQERLDTIINKTIYHCDIHNVDVLNVELLGDFVSGAIQVTGRIEQEEDVVSQIILVGEMLSNAIHKLNENIPTVKVYCVFGNHGRLTPNKKESVNRENCERLIYNHIKLRLPTIKVVTSLNDDFLAIKVKGKSIILAHGDKDSLTNAVKNFVAILNYKPDEIHIGHIHNFNVKNDNDTEIISNGSLIGTDEYALSIRNSTMPSQVLRIYDEDTCTYNLKVN